jgi:DNA-binding winged helix-turn-helix (wHTH) protein
MGSNGRMARIYTLGPFRLDAEEEVLYRAEKPLALGKRACALLRVLAERPGQLISKEELTEAAWCGLAVEESNLTVQISALRRVLGEERGGEGWIETLPRRGYRFVGPVATDAAAQVAVRPQAEAGGIRPASAEPERRLLSIMSCELVCTRLDLEDMREAVKAFQNCVAEIVGSYQGFVAKHVGNAVLVYFGYPVAHENHMHCLGPDPGAHRRRAAVHRGVNQDCVGEWPRARGCRPLRTHRAAPAADSARSCRRKGAH